jgi:indolepyruvate ferredoxin oxidoreductase
MSLAAFKWGRMAVVDRAFVQAEIAKGPAVVSELPRAPALGAEAGAIVDAVGAAGETRRLLEIRVPDLIDYQDAAYARRYAEVVKRALQAEKQAAPGLNGFAEAVARFLYKLMAYKDEYEVARLHTDPAFLAARCEFARLHGQVQPRPADDPKRDLSPASCRRGSLARGCSARSGCWRSSSACGRGA